MKKLFLAIVAAVLTGCGGDKTFEVEVDIPAIGTQEMTVVYTSGNGNRAVIKVPALEGKFSFEGIGVPESTVEIFKANKRLFASFPAVNGQKLKLVADGDSLYLEDSQTVVVTAYADTVVTAWPKFVSPELVMGVDSVHTFEPEGVWVFTASVQERTAALTDTLKAYAKGKKPLRDVYVSADMTQWRMFTQRDSATWTQALLPDGPVALKGILLSTPCLVEVDTAGVVSRVQRLE